MLSASVTAQVSSDSLSAKVDTLAVAKPEENPDPKKEARKAKRMEAKRIRQAWPIDPFKGWHVGFIGGAGMTLPNIKTFSGGELTGTEPTWGWRVGMEMLVGVNNWLGITFGANYGERNITTNFNLNVIDTVYALRDRNKVGTLTIPVGLKFDVPKIGKRFSLSPIAGGNLELNMNVASNRDSVETNTYGSFVVHNRDGNMDRVNRVGFSIYGGLCFDIKFNTSTLSIGPSYHYGLLDLFAEPARYGLEGRTDYLTIDIRYYL
jgi:hypothetical protein